ncbi:protein CUSTOS [Chanos chanos]|uniref:Protein CUSTOS n=1 Tax=Chanos chanos TaxID=29144 RepID=A0A6J2URK4_CHACN|nr:protein CUSTOS [Chanos chanos]
MSAEDSSSEDENTERLKEAIWSFGATHNNGTHHANGGDVRGENNDRPSRRAVASEHEHDGNELRTTPEFRAHVAKKLGAMLDGCIAVVSTETPDSNAGPCQSRNDEEDDEGFQLFSTSIPGKWTKEPTPPPKRPRAPSSSDSDSEMEMRLREAAVSISDLLPPASGPADAKRTEDKKKEETEEVEESRCSPAPKKKKKKKRKAPQEVTEGDEESEQPAAPPQPERTDEPQRKKTKKKKKKKSDESLKEGEQ